MMNIMSYAYTINVFRSIIDNSRVINELRQNLQHHLRSSIKLPESSVMLLIFLLYRPQVSMY